MKIAQDAKRMLNNGTGLGNHARILANALMRDFPEYEYQLYTPRIDGDISMNCKGYSHFTCLRAN